MTQERWTAVDTYITDLLHRPDQALDAALAGSAAAGLPSIAVPPTQGKMLTLLALSSAPATSSRLALWVATARFVWQGRCRLVEG